MINLNLILFSSETKKYIYIIYIYILSFNQVIKSKSLTNYKKKILFIILYFQLSNKAFKNKILLFI